MPPVLAAGADWPRTRSAVLVLLAWGGLAAGLALWPSSSRADCVEALPNVTCTAADVDGYDAGANPNLNVTVEAGASVDNAAADAIRLNDGNTVTVEAGATLTTTGDDADGIDAGTNNVITHSGAITTDGMNSDGIEVGGTGNVVTNSGTIGVSGMNAAGINAGNANTLTNAGVIVVNGDGGVGILAGNDGTVTNSATISGTVANTTGIRVGNGTVDMTTDVENTGNISLVGDGSIGVDAGNGNEIDNAGRIESTGSNAIGVRLGAGNALSNSLLIDANGDGARGVVVNGAGNTLTNSGTIRSRPATEDMDLFGPAVDFSAAAGANTLENRGFVTGLDSQIDGTLLGTAILGGAGAETILNRGLITGDVLLGGGDDVLDLRTGSGSNGMLDGGAGANDQLLLQGNGSGVLDLDDVTGFESLRIDVDPDAMPSGTPGNGAWQLTGGANFVNGTTLAAGTLQTNEIVTLGGNFNQLAGTTLGVLVDPVAGTAGRLAVSGTATLAADTTLRLFPLSPLRSATLTVLSATNIVGGFGSTPQNTALLTFTVIPMPMEIQLQIVRNAYASFATTSNQQSAAGHLDEILASGSVADDLADVLLALEPLSAEELAAAFDELHPEAFDTHTGQMARLGRMFASVALEPRPWCKPLLYGLRPGQREDVPCGPRGWSTWMRALAGFGDRDSGSDFRNSDHSDQGLMGGIDWRPNRNWVVSTWLGISSSDLDVDEAGEGDLDTFELGIASVFRLSGARARAAFGYGRGSHEHDREITFGTIDRTAESEYDSNRIHALLELGWVFALGNWRLEPLASLDVTWIQEGEINESGAGSLDLEVAERDNTVVGTDFGGRIAYRHFQNPFSDHSPAWAQGTWTPELSMRWRSTWTGAERDLDARLSGAPSGTSDFRSEAQDTEQGAQVGAHVTFQPHGSAGAISIGYDGYFGDGATSHSFGAKLRLFF